MFNQSALTSPDIDLSNADNYLMEDGDILFARTGASVGKTYRFKRSDGKVYYAGFLIRARINQNFDSEFVFQNTLTSKYDNFIKIVSQRSGQPGVNAQEYASFDLMVPTLEEQQKIGIFFKTLDVAIALHQQKLDKLKELKKAYLAQFFKQKIRFFGFLEEWERRKFKDFISKAGKKNIQNRNYISYSVSNKSGLVSQAEQFEGSRLENLEKESYKIVNSNDFVYNPARINVGSIAFNNLEKTVIVSSLYVVLNMGEKLDNEFILQFIKSQTFIKEVKRNTEGSVREYLFFKSFKNINFPYIPNVEEQRKIGLFFKRLDDTIVLQEEKLTKLNKLKKVYLQKMFV